jgi:hypothetical protein
MAKQELKDKIRSIAKKAYNTLTSPESVGSKSDSLEATPDKSTKSFPIIDKFPDLEPVIISLLTDQFGSFVDDIWWVAPRPTTFKIILVNKQAFYLIYTQRSWIAQIEGKKYYLNNHNEEARAAESIARILRYGEAKTEEGPSVSVPTGEDMPPPADEEESTLPSPEFPEEEEIPINIPA